MRVYLGGRVMSACTRLDAFLGSRLHRESRKVGGGGVVVAALRGELVYNVVPHTGIFDFMRTTCL